jgi:hypothetical protein
MASVEQCEQALHRLCDQLGRAGGGTAGQGGLDRTLSCRLTDPDVAFAGRLRDGSLGEIRQVDADAAGRAKIRLRMSGDDLLRLVGGELDLARAWAGGRVKVEANPLDLLRLRGMFSPPAPPRSA